MHARSTIPAILALLLVFSSANGRILRVEPVENPPGIEALPRDTGCNCDTAWIGTTRYELALPGDTFTFGDTVRMVYTVTNRGTEPRTFWFGTTCQSWFGVFPSSCGPLDEGCTGIWDPGRPCYAMETHFTLDPMQSKVFRLDWSQHSTDGYRVLPGDYVAWGIVDATPYDGAALLSVPFQIVPYGPHPIQDAIDAASAGDTVLVGPGLYMENLILLAPQDGIVLKAEGTPEETIIDAGGRGSAVYAFQVGLNTVIEGFTIQNGAAGPGEGPPESEYYGLYLTAGALTALNHTSPTIRGNVIQDNQSAWNGGAVATNYDCAPRIEGNLFLRNQAAFAGGAIYSSLHYYGASGLVRGNTFVGNRAQQGAAIYDDGGSVARLRVENNIFYANAAEVSGGGLHCRGVSTINDCNTFWLNEPDGTSGCSNPTNVVLADPLFCNPAADDYRLRPDSPCAPLNSPTCGLMGAFDVGCTLASSGGPDPRPTLSVHPNPFTRALAITPSGAGGNVAVYSASGRVVWSAPAGSAGMPVVWDGRDRGGRAVPAGVYFVRLARRGGMMETRTVVRAE